MPGLQLVIELDSSGAIKGVSTLDKAYGKFTGSAGAKAATAASAMKKIEGATHQVSSALRKLSLIGGVSLGVISGKMIHTGMQFEQSLANVRAASGATAEEIKQMETVTRKYGSTTIFSANEVSKAWLQLIKGGMNMAQVNDTIGKALLFAGASGMSLADTITNLDDLMDTFQVQASESGRLVETLLGAMSVTPIDALMEAMKGAGTVAAELGVEYKDLIAHFTILEARGLAGSRAGMAYAMMLNALLNPTDEVKQALGDMVFTGTNLNEVLDHLRASGMDAKRAIEVFGGGLRAPGTLIAKLLSATKEEMAAVEAAFSDTSKAQAAFDARMDTTSAKMTMFKNAVDEKLIQTFEAMKEPLSSVMDALKYSFDEAMPKIVEQVKGLGEWADKHKDLIASVIAGLPKMLLLAVGLKLLADGTGLVIGAVKILTPLLGFLAANPIFAAIGLGITGAALFDKMLRAIGIGNPLQNIVDAFANMPQKIDDANTNLGKFKRTLADMPFANLAIDYSKNKMYPPSGEIYGPPAPAGYGQPPPGNESTPAPETNWAELSRRAQEEADFRMALSAGVRENAIADAEKTSSASQAYYLDTIRANTAADEAWLTAKIGLAAMERDAVVGNAAEMAQARIDYDAAVKEAELAHNEAVWQDWIAKNEGMLAMIKGLEAGWDTMIETALDKEMTGKARREAMWESMKQSFLRSTSDMLKKELVLKVKNWVLAEGMRKPFTIRERFDAAKVGAVKAYSAFAGIPIIGPALGAIAAATAFAFLMAFHKGGFIGNDERIIKVQTEEFIMQRSAVRGIGRENMEYMNATGRIPTQSRGTVASGRIVKAGGASIGPFVFQIAANDKETANGIAEFIEEKIVPMLETAIGRRKFSLEGEM